MSAADPQKPELQAAAVNGTHSPARKNGSAPRRRRSTPAVTVAPPAPLAGFDIDTAPVDSPMWPVQPSLWFQPELTPPAPAWSSLSIEHRNRITPAGFLFAEEAPMGRLARLECSTDLIPPRISPKLPESGLVPLGWDPRAVCLKEESK